MSDLSLHLDTTERAATAMGRATLVMAARVFALTMAFFVFLATVQDGGIGIGKIQPIALAAILLIAACAKRSISTLLAVGYVLGFLVFLLLRPIADETFIPVHYQMPIVMDQVMFLGGLPNLWLQDLFYVPGRVGVLDVALSAVYITYFFAPHVTALVVWRTRPQLFPKAIVAISITFLAGLFFYFAVPTAPPWLASDTGDIDADVVRILPEISAQVAGNTYNEASRAVGSNDVAAMPSLHTALTCTVALIMASYGRRWRIAGGVYLALMALALVYLGEHYVIDEVAGIALAVGVWRLVSRHRLFAWLSPRAEPEAVSAEAAMAGNRAA